MKVLDALLHRKPQRCAVCEGYGTVQRSYVFGDDPVCTCDAGEFDELTLHDPHCDTVPCPCCPAGAYARRRLGRIAVRPLWKKDA
jgi:hypothetical protein